MDYKGIYYGDSKSQRFFEFGAHFKYSDLYRQLEILGGKICNFIFPLEIGLEMDMDKMRKF